MSAAATTLWFIDTPDPASQIREGLVNDVDDARALAQTIYGENVLVPFVDTDLATAAQTHDTHVYAGSFGGLSVVTCSLFATQRPSTLTRTVNALRASHRATLLHTDPEDSVGVFACWETGELRRSFSASPVDLYEDSGLPFIFEGPFWAGEHPLRYAPGVDPQPFALPFHPQHLAEESNRQWLGFRFTHPLAASDTDPARIPVTGFSIHPVGYEPDDVDRDTYRRSHEPPPDPEAELPERGRIARYFGF